VPSTAKYRVLHEPALTLISFLLQLYLPFSASNIPERYQNLRHFITNFQLLEGDVKVPRDDGMLGRPVKINQALL